MRQTAIWISGIVASSFCGYLMTFAVDTRIGGNSGEFRSIGIIAGACAFACFRLWLGERQAPN
jgi:hypothetical protein